MRFVTVSVGAPPSTTSSESPRRFGARPWIHRILAAVVLPALLLLGLEGGLRLAGQGRDPGFLIPDESPGYYRTNPDFVSLFMPGSFDLRPLNFRVALRKPAGTVRIVVLGESVTQGIPAPPFALVPQLRAQLRARYPEKNLEVINTGIVAINSHVVYRVARDLARFKPDLYIVYLGNNEVVGPYGPGCAYRSQMPPLWVIRLSGLVRATRTGQLLGRLMEKTRRANQPPVEWGGMSMFVDSAVGGDDPRLEAVYRNFEANLSDIVQVATDAGAKTLLCTVVSNLKDCAPFLSQHRAGLTTPELAAWQLAFNQGVIAWRLGEADAAQVHLREALRIDPQYADTCFMLGRLALQAGENPAARELLLAAQRWDALRFRPDPRLNEIIRQVVRRHPATGLVDAARLMGSDPAALGPPTGREYLFEHVHFNWAGNFLLAREVAGQAATLLFGGVAGRGAWLDAAGTAAALAYSAHEEIPVLQRLATIVVAPPFTNQLTYSEDQARFARALAQAQAAGTTPQALQQAGALGQAATAADPENAELAKIEEEIADDLGDLSGALAQAQRARRLQPASFALAANEAIKLSRLGRYPEAEKLLQQAARTCTPRDAVLLAPAFADLFARTRRFAEGRSYFDEAIARQPAARSLRWHRGRLALLGRDAPAAEGEFRAILADEPANMQASEMLIGLLEGTGRPGEAEEVSLAVADHQPGNQANNLRAARICEQRGDDAKALRYLQAAARSGPVTAAIQLRIARKCFSQGQRAESLRHLAEAKLIAEHEADDGTRESINEIISQVRTSPR